MKGPSSSGRPWLLLLAAVLTALVLLNGLLGPRGPAATVYAASSLTDVLQEIAAAYQDHTGKRVDLHFHASAILERQIRAGGGADLFVSASPGEVDRLEAAGLVVSRRPLFRNRLVLLERADRPGWEERLRAGGETLRRSGGGPVAIGDWEQVPAGRYAREALEDLGVWESLRERLIPGIHVRQVIEYVRRGEADLGIAYGTDARMAEDLRVIWVFPEESHSPILYEAALIQGADHPDLGRQFLDYLLHRARRGLIRKHGFLLAR